MDSVEAAHLPRARLPRTRAIEIPIPVSAVEARPPTESVHSLIPPRSGLLARELLRWQVSLNWGHAKSGDVITLLGLLTLPFHANGAMCEQVAVAPGARPQRAVRRSAGESLPVTGERWER